jgi:hypothetical protein
MRPADLPLFGFRRLGKKKLATSLSKALLSNHGPTGDAGGACRLRSDLVP